jgi:uracil-DNA glycosylase
MPQEALQLLKEHLQQQAAHGVTHLWLNDEARTALQALRGESKAPVPVPQASPKQTPAAPVETSVPKASLVTDSSAPAMDKKAELAKLALQAENSTKVVELGTLRKVMVFATGSPDADIMFIGEAPGAEEEKQREPFVGPAGQLLTKIIQAMGLRRSEVYISNICKFRPMIDDGQQQGSKNRPPTKGEMAACLPYITGEINLIQPKVIVALGSTAATGLGIEGSVGKLRGNFSAFRNFPVMVTYHPSYLLRCEQDDGGGIREKRLVWEDMMLVMERVGLSISEKQRGYFSKARG